MSEQVVRLAEEDYEETIDFLNYVFSHSSQRTDFPSVLPKFFRDNPQIMNDHFAIRKNGRIRAVAGLFPMGWNVARHRLKAAGIGSVATHPYDRGLGYMRVLMEACLRHIRTERFHIALLDGERRRYGYYGFEKTGSTLQFLIRMNDVRPIAEAGRMDNIRFENIHSHEAGRLAAAQRLHDMQPVRVERPIHEFYRYARTWKHEPWAILDGEGRMVGYLIANSDKDRVTELCVERSGLEAQAARQWVLAHNLYQADFIVPPWAYGTARALGGISGAFSVRDCYNFLVLDWTTVLAALLEVKQAMTAVPEGALTIHIRDYGTLALEIRGGNVLCERTSAQPDIVWDAMTAMRQCFGPLPCAYVGELPGRVQFLAAAWFPLPLHWSEQDRI